MEISASEAIKNPADKNTAIYQQAFTLINGELQPGIDARIIPCTLSSVSSYNDFRPTVASGEKSSGDMQFNEHIFTKL